MTLNIPGMKMTVASLLFEEFAMRFYKPQITGFSSFAWRAQFCVESPVYPTTDYTFQFWLHRTCSRSGNLSSYVAENLPENDKLKEEALVVEHASKQVVHGDQLIEEFIHKMDASGCTGILLTKPKLLLGRQQSYKGTMICLQNFS